MGAFLMSKKWERRQIISQGKINEWFKLNYSTDKHFLYILGMGFDKRMCDGVMQFIKTGIPFTLWKVTFDEGESSPSREYQNESNKNKEMLDSIAAGIPAQEKNIVFWQNDGRSSRYIAEISASKIIKSSANELCAFSDIIFDISALPQTLYLCMLNMLLNCCNTDQTVYIIVNENYTIDMKTEPVEIDEFAHEMQGFSAPTEDLESVLIWYPILGEVNPLLLKKHYDYLISSSKHVDEICPVVPFPAVDVRRADNILKGYRKEFFSDWKIDKKNIIYASETNPLRVCESLYSTSMHYKKVLRPLGECKFVFSAITSKLMSIGVFLAAYDLKKEKVNISLLNVNNKGYKIIQQEENNIESSLTCLLLSNTEKAGG